jgi:hypothetical protein
MTPVIYSNNWMWNIDASVGKGGLNSNQEDVSYIQWYYWLAARNPETPPDRKAIYSAVEITGSCSGTDSDPLVKSIIAHQTHLKHPLIDGRVSVANAGGKVVTSAFFVYRIGARLCRMNKSVWPRLDRIDPCPAKVAQASLRAIPDL